MKRIASAILAASLVCTTLITSVSATEEVSSAKVLQDFSNAASADQVASAWGGGGDFELSLIQRGEATNTMLKTTFNGANQENQNRTSALYIMLSTKNWSGKTGFSFWVSNTNTDRVWVEFYVQDTAGARHKVAGNAQIALTPDGSEESSNADLWNADGERFFIPGSFTGTVEIPFASLKDNLDPSSIHEICFGSDGIENQGKSIFYDNFKLYGATDADDVVLQDFEADGATVDSTTYVWSGGAPIDRELVGNGDKALSVKVIGPNSEGVAAAVTWVSVPDHDWSDTDGLTFYIDNSKNGDFPADIAIISSNGETETAYKIKNSGGVAYLITEDGTSDRASFNTYRMTIPGGFVGTVRIPFSSFNEGFDLTNMTKLEIGTDANAAKDYELVIDDLTLYTGGDNGNEDDGPVDPLMIQNFEKSHIADALGFWSDGAKMEAELQTESLAEGSRQGAKLTYGQPNGTQTGSVTMFNILNNDWTGTSGLRIWVENKEEEQPIDVDIYFVESSTAVPERWVTKPGRAEIVYFDAVAKTYEKATFNSRFRIPAGFKGWVEIPFTSFEVFIPMSDDGNMDLSNITEFALGADNASNLGATLYLDDIQLYKNSLTETWEEKENENENDNNNDNNNENDNDNDTGDNDNTDDNNNSDADDDNGGVTETGVEANLAILFLFAAAAVVVFRVKKACR